MVGFGDLGTDYAEALMLQKELPKWGGSGTQAGIRTQDQLVKSQLLYH